MRLLRMSVAGRNNIRNRFALSPQIYDAGSSCGLYKSVGLESNGITSTLTSILVITPVTPLLFQLHLLTSLTMAPRTPAPCPVATRLMTRPTARSLFSARNGVKKTIPKITKRNVGGKVKLSGRLGKFNLSKIPVEGKALFSSFKIPEAQHNYLHYHLFLLFEYCGILLHASLACLLYTSPSPRDKRQSRMPSSA